MNFRARSSQSDGKPVSRFAARRRRAFSLVEIMVAGAVMGIMSLGMLQALLQSRRVTEGSILQNSALNIMQGYIEQLKNMDYADLTVSPASGTAEIDLTPDNELDNDPTDTSIDPLVLPLQLSTGSPPSTIPAIGSPAPTGAVDNERKVLIRYTSLTPTEADKITVNFWIWVKDLTGEVTDLSEAKAITIIYTYTVRDGGRIKRFRHQIRSIRTVVPSH